MGFVRSASIDYNHSWCQNDILKQADVLYNIHSDGHDYEIISGVPYYYTYEHWKPDSFIFA